LRVIEYLHHEIHRTTDYFLTAIQPVMFKLPDSSLIMNQKLRNFLHLADVKTIEPQSKVVVVKIIILYADEPKE
jgi:hypothetical protein